MIKGCNTCKHWYTPIRNEQNSCFRPCQQIKIPYNMFDIDQSDTKIIYIQCSVQDADVITGKDFYCILYEDKE